MQPQNNNTYNQPPMMPPMPPRGQWQRMRNTWQHRVMRGVAKKMDAFPKWLTQYPIVVYILALMVVSFMYSEYSLPWYYMLSGIIAVLANER